MLYTKDIRDYLKQVNNNLNLGFTDFFVGKLDESKTKALAVYNLKTSNPYITTYLGGIEAEVDDILYISILIHYTENYPETEIVSQALYEYLKLLTDVVINGHTVNYFKLISGNEDVGTDSKGIYERVIQVEIDYNKK